VDGHRPQTGTNRKRRLRNNPYFLSAHPLHNVSVRKGRLPVVLIALPWFASELVALLIGAVLALVVVMAKRRPVRAFDHVREYSALESRIRTKANHRFTYPLRLWLQKGE
jgi:hypothetical protein